jgi:hypothetical protein
MNLFTSKIWMNVEIFSFIVMFYVANLTSFQIWKKQTKKKPMYGTSVIREGTISQICIPSIFISLQYSLRHYSLQ